MFLFSKKVLYIVISQKTLTLYFKMWFRTFLDMKKIFYFNTHFYFFVGHIVDIVSF